MQKNFVIGGLLLLISKIGLAEDRSSHTRWAIHNARSEVVIVSCQGQEKIGGRAISPLELRLAARSSKIFEWGDAWYNDGMGLNPASWSCQARAEGDKRVLETANFTTDWGEDIDLTVESQGSKLTLQQSGGRSAKQ